jgi:hypothetical protein
MLHWYLSAWWLLLLLQLQLWQWPQKAVLCKQHVDGGL